MSLFEELELFFSFLAHQNGLLVLLSEYRACNIRRGCCKDEFILNVLDNHHNPLFKFRDIHSEVLALDVASDAGIEVYVWSHAEPVDTVGLHLCVCVCVCESVHY